MPEQKTEKYRIDFKYNFKIYFNIVKKYKTIILGILLTSFVLEASFVVDKFLFKILIDNGTNFAAKILSKNDFIGITINVLIIFISLVLIRIFCDWLSVHLVDRLEAKSITELKRKFFNHLIHLSYNFHTSNKTGSLIARLIRGGGAVEKLSDVIIFNFIPLLWQLIIVSVSLMGIDGLSSIIIFVTIVLFVTYNLTFQSLQQKANVLLNQAEDTEKANISDIFTNIDSIKHFGKEIIIKKRFEQLTSNTNFALIKQWDYFRWIKSGQDLILATGTFLLVYFSLTKFLNGQTTLGSIVFIYTVFGNLTGPLFGFVHGIKGFYRSMADFEDLFKYGKIENEIKDKPNAKNLKIKESKIEFKNVNFKYNQTELFKNFSLIVEPQKKVALVGHSGSGKSTLIKLLYRLYDLNSGEILIDDKNIKDITQESLRSEMSIVPQECVLFDDTIYNNIAFSNQDASKKEVFDAMKFAQLYNIVQKFPYKENTIVGERGVKLSGGEKQRVSIARAILANKKVLILDEATSALDSQTEHEIQQDLEKLMKNRTSIIIAHRLSTIMKADKIVVLKDGEIVQMGNHNELIKQEGEYKKLWDLQRGGYID